MKINNRLIWIAITTVILQACDDFVKIDPPRTSLVKQTVFDNETTADAAMTSIYYHLSMDGFASNSNSGISFFGTYSSDEQINYASENYQQVNENEILAANNIVDGLWSTAYKSIYDANAVLQGIQASEKISESLKKQLEGEAKFVRAFCHFYLVNMFGSVPIITITDYRSNSNASRKPVSDVYNQIVNDLTDAKNLLPEDYAFANNERVRANKYAAIALLARAYLYMEEWEKAEAEASLLIANTGLYSLKDNLKDVFLINSSEAILQWWSEFSPNDFVAFAVFSDPPPYGAIRPEFATSFEPGDSRGTIWVGISEYANYYEVKKYTFTNYNEPIEYSTVLRLAEVYLIRAEARAQQSNITGAQEDINIIRDRADLPNTTANDKESLLQAVMQERKSELFSEGGHRWFDLKRTNTADAILAPIKGSSWQPTDVLYPIPERQILNDPAMKNAQNPGY